MSMFQSAVKQLTLWYVGALFLVCLIFSVPTYFVAFSRLEHGARKQADILVKEFSVDPLTGRIDIMRDEQINRDRQQLLRTIVVANLIVLVAGAYFSYQFAKQTLKPIEEAHEAQTRFATDASHELRTPLAVMQAEIEVALRDKTFDTKQAKHVLASNLEEIARLRNLSEQLLGLTRLDSGQLQTSKVHLSKLVHEEITHIKKQHPGITIHPTIEDKLTVQGDEHLLRQLLSILADNATQYAGDKPPRLDISLRKQDGSVQLSLTDHGIGIRSSEIPHIFDRFYRGSNAGEHSTGHGLGLAIAKQIVDSHGGRLSAGSQPGTSTTFHITLPA